MVDALPHDLIERLLERKYPNAMNVLDSVVARRREKVYVSRRDAALYDEIISYRNELRSRRTEELLDLYEQEASEIVDRTTAIARPSKSHDSVAITASRKFSLKHRSNILDGPIE